MGTFITATFITAEVCMTAYTLKRLGVLDKVLAKAKKAPKAFKEGVKGFKEGYGNYVEAELV